VSDIKEAVKAELLS